MFDWDMFLESEQDFEHIDPSTFDWNMLLESGYITQEQYDSAVAQGWVG